MKITTEKFIQRAIEKHGNRYKYDLVEYHNAKIPVRIICKLHGEFKQAPQVHIPRMGNCPKCAYIQRSKTRKSHNNWWDYEKSKEFTIKLNLTCRREWYAYCKTNKRPKQLPINPKSVYKKDWQGWPEWIGANGRTKTFLSFEQAREITRTLNLRSYEDWVHFSTMKQRPNNIPFNPKSTYPDQWISWGDWLGFKNRANGNLSGIIYIIQQEDLPNNIYKIGRTYRLDKRLSEHNRTNKTKFRIHTTFNVLIMKNAEDLAHNLALKYGNRFKYKRSKEHFKIDDIDSFLKKLSKIL